MAYLSHTIILLSLPYLSTPLFNSLLYYIIMGYNVQQYARANIYCYYIWPMTTITTTCTYLRVCVDIQLLKKSRREFGWQNLCHLECVPKIIEICLSGYRDHGMRWNTRVWISSAHRYITYNNNNNTLHSLLWNHSLILWSFCCTGGVLILCIYMLRAGQT